MSNIIRINPLKPEFHLLEKVREVLNSSGIIGYPTDTVYGLGANAMDEKAVGKIFSLKERDLSKPMLVVVSRNYDLEEIVSEIPPQAKRLIDVFWPGPLTLIFKANRKLPLILTSGTGKIGVRVPDNLIALELLSCCGFPVTSTSANRSGMTEAKTAQQVRDCFLDKLNLIIDGGESRQTLPTTIIDFTGDMYKIIRKGTISSDMVVNALTN